MPTLLAAEVFKGSKIVTLAAGWLWKTKEWAYPHTFFFIVLRSSCSALVLYLHCLTRSCLSCLSLAALVLRARV